MSRSINPTPQFFDADGDPLSGGLMYFFESGTNTAKTTFSDINETIANTQPLVLTGDGRLPNCFFTGSAKQVLTDSDDVELWSRDPVSSLETTNFGAAWDATTIYDANSVVTLSGVFYVSLTNGNQNNNPASSPTNWTQFDLLKRWNTNETYAIGDPVTLSGKFYLSLTASNAGNQPDTSPVNWQSTSSATVTVQTFTSSGTWNKPTGVSYIIVEVIGGGGGGGGNDTALSSSGGGGGGGGYARVVLSAASLTSETVTVGGGGAGGAAGNNNGVAGVTSSFGSLCVATGGAAGQVASSDVSPLGGIGTTGDMLVAGSAGLPDQDTGGVGANRSSPGGASAFGSGGASLFNSGNGASGRDFGGGGAGGYNDGVSAGNRAGGNGATGLVIVTEYY